MTARKNVIPKKPIINAHTHVFTGGNIPRYLGKSILPWPFYLLIDIHFLLSIVKFFHSRRQNLKYNRKYQDYINAAKTFRNGFYRIPFGKQIVFFLNLILLVGFCYALLSWVQPNSALKTHVDDALGFHPILQTIVPLFEGKHVLISIVGIYLFGSVRWARRLIWLVLTQLFSFLKHLPGKALKTLLSRYWEIIKYTLYGYNTESKSYSGQKGILSKLAHQYPSDTQFVILPMDMEYMQAGKTSKNGRFHAQMEELLDIKESPTYGAKIHPFIFIDPRRVEQEGKEFLNVKFDKGGFSLDPACKVSKYMDQGACGIKIYPALGYYPFDESLLPLWLFCAQEQIPIMTHCIRGIIYYRGKKKKEWEQHPVFKRIMGKNDKGESLISPLPLTQSKAKEYQENFTHPMNYLCLLDDELLKHVLRSCSWETQNLFGFDPKNPNKPLKHSLCKLKICLAHYGGEDEWKRFLHNETNQYDKDILKHPKKGLYHDPFSKYDAVTNSSEIKWGRLENHWHEASWYTLISSMMLLYDHVFADLSYILHDDEIRPLLQGSLRNEYLKHKILFGTDFYVVRNHLSDKEMLYNIQDGMDELDFDIIARENPLKYLELKHN